ncbi:hypothetical protein JTB14_028364 [Gonioctena quinquepunctata]|nr:hypothetical protein JTB14_028364 [Gonioctena quinquepunctata]
MTEVVKASYFSSSGLLHQELNGVSWSGLGGSELKVMELKTRRKLQFFCDDCLKILPTLLAKIEKLTLEVEALRMQPNRANNEETFFVELSERQKRMCNVMFFNLPEKDFQIDTEFVKRKLYYTIKQCMQRFRSP